MGTDVPARRTEPSSSTQNSAPQDEGQGAGSFNQDQLGGATPLFSESVTMEPPYADAITPDGGIESAASAPPNYSPSVSAENSGTATQPVSGLTDAQKLSILQTVGNWLFTYPVKDLQIQGKTLSPKSVNHLIGSTDSSSLPRELQREEMVLHVALTTPRTRDWLEQFTNALNSIKGNSGYSLELQTLQKQPEPYRSAYFIVRIN